MWFIIPENEVFDADDPGSDLTYLNSHAGYYDCPEWFERTRCRTVHHPINRFVSTIVSSLNNLQHPVKLIPWSVVKKLKRFPHYEEDFAFVPLSTESYSRCVAISHQRSDENGSRHDAKWLFDNSQNVKLPDHLTDPLLFYDWTSLPRARDGSHLSEEQSSALAQTYKAGLECVPLLFSQRGLAIPTKGYLFRYWCFYEYFVMTYHYAKVCVVSLVDPLAFDLRVVDGVLKDLENALMLSSRAVFDYRGSLAKSMCIISLDGANTSHIVEAVHFLGQGRKEPERLLNYYQRICRVRAVVVDLIRARIRQCSVSVPSDRQWLDGAMEKYLKAPEIPVISQSSVEEARELEMNARIVLSLGQAGNNVKDAVMK